MPSIRASLPPRERDYDFSNVGKVGRRTGATLALRKLDQYGLEEVSGLFSSPRKPSPVKNSIEIAESVEEELGDVTLEPQKFDRIRTPATNSSVQRSTTRRSALRVRSASPRKSGITGTAKRSNGADIMGSKQPEFQVRDKNQLNGSTTSTPLALGTTRASSTRPVTTASHRFSPDGTPLRARALRGSKTTQVVRTSTIAQFVRGESSSDDEETPSRIQADPKIHDNVEQPADVVDVMGDEDAQPGSRTSEVIEHDITQDEVTMAPDDNEEEEEACKSPKPNLVHHAQPTTANSRRKRRSSAIEDHSALASSPIAKRRKRQTPESLPRDPQRVSALKKAKPASKSRGRPPLQDKSKNTKLSTRQEKQVADVVEKIRARPGGAARTLHLLRRETPSDDTVLRTRTGRLSVKPLAYWRNEKVVFTDAGDEASTGLADGSRFPLNTVSYVHRIDESVVRPEKKKGGVKRRKPGKKPGRDNKADDDEDSDIDIDGNVNDPDAAEWELDRGTIATEVAVWDAEHQVHSSMKETVEIAHSSGAIETTEVKGSTFRFAKLLSTPFFGTGVVDLPPGGVKKMKNSRKMHMTFFVCTGRVTVEVGAPGGQDARFSIGKGGYWQVPRGNNYAILNENGKAARLFFSQACEVPVVMQEE